MPSCPMYAVSTNPAMGSAARLASAGKVMPAISLSKSVSLHAKTVEQRKPPFQLRMNLNCLHYIATAIFATGSHGQHQVSRKPRLVQRSHSCHDMSRDVGW